MMLDYVQTHWMEIAFAVTSVVTAASAIAALTPTKSDDRVVDAIIRIIDKFGMNVGQRNPRK